MEEYIKEKVRKFIHGNMGTYIYQIEIAELIKEAYLKGQEDLRKEDKR